MLKVHTCNLQYKYHFFNAVWWYESNT